MLLDNFSCVITLCAIFVNFVFCFLYLAVNYFSVECFVLLILIFGCCFASACMFFFSFFFSVYVTVVIGCLPLLLLLLLLPLLPTLLLKYYYYHLDATDHHLHSSVGTCSGDLVLCYSQVPPGSDAVLPEGEYHL